MSITHLGVNKAHYLSQGDLATRCPGCSGNSTENIGVLTIDGSPRDVHKCKNCNKIYSREDGGIASLVDEAKEVFKTENVGFTANSGTVVNTTNGSSYNYDAQMRSDVQQIRQSLDNIKNNSSNWSSLQYKFDDMANAIRALANTVESMANKNVELMNRLATDPLVNIRKRVSDFNLE